MQAKMKADNKAQVNRDAFHAGKLKSFYSGSTFVHISGIISCKLDSVMWL